jgi:hypothetical protein
MGARSGWTRPPFKLWATSVKNRLTTEVLKNHFGPNAYNRDGLITVHNHTFMGEPQFQRAYDRGVAAIGGDDKYRIQWRVHVALWAAASAAKLEGDFVECGVNYGFMSSAIMEALDWDKLGKTRGSSTMMSAATARSKPTRNICATASMSAESTASEPTSRSGATNASS